MDASGRSSPRRRQLQGPRPPRLAISKDSHKVRKPAATPPPSHIQPPKQPWADQSHQQQQARQPVIIYDASPKVIHTRPADFMALVQRLTGPGSKQAQFDAAAGPSSDAPTMELEPPDLLLSPSAALSPATRLATIDRSVRPWQSFTPLPLSVEGMTASSSLFSPLPLNPSCLSLLDDRSPFLGTAAQAMELEPREFLLSPAARLATIERSVRPLSIEGMTCRGSVVDSLDPAVRSLSSPGPLGILSPAAAPPAALSWQFSPLPLNPSCLSLLGDRFPFLGTASGTRVGEGLGVPFVLMNSKEHSLLPATVSVPAGFHRNVVDISGDEAPAGGPVNRDAEPARDPQVGLDPGCCIRRLFQQLHVRRTAISSSSNGGVPFGAGFSDVQRLSSDAEESLEDLNYKMILAMLGVGIPKSTSNVPGTSPKTITTSFIRSSPQKLAILLSIADKLESLKHGIPVLSGAVLADHSDIVSLSSLLTRCILLCRGILGILSTVGAEGTKETLDLPVFAFDDLTYAHHNKVTKMNPHSIPTSVIDPIYSLTIFTRSLLYLDLSSCSSLAQLPPSIGNLHNLAALNLSDCYSLCALPVSLGGLKNLQILVLSCCRELRSLPVSLCKLSKLRLLDLAGCSCLEKLPDSLVNLGHLENLNLSDCKVLKELPQPFANLQELKYLNLSGSHGVDLDAEYLCTLANLKCLTLSPLTNIEGFPDSFQELVNRLDRLRWWKNNHVHPQCNPKAASMHSYTYYEHSIINRLLTDEDDISSKQKVTFVCIVGESGMGKTELVRRIYSNHMILDTFNLRIWVNMCDEKRLLGKILEFTTCAYCTDAPIRVLQEIVIEELTGKRFLLVLDDSDNKTQNFWSYVQRLLIVCAKGSAVIVTTKSNEVADLVRAMQTCYLSPVSKEECFTIFKGHVLGSLDMKSYPHLESIGWKVVEKSGGNPMCVKALSGLLSHSEIGLSEIDMLADGTTPALRLCYDLLPVHLQRCFKFCSLFPKDYIFIKHHIIRLWISQGFIFPEEGNQPEDTGLRYFDELVCRSFFQHSPFHNDQDDEFVMHELFHDLATSVSKNECFRCEEPFCSLPENICHLSLVLSDFKTVALAEETRNLQSFLVVRESSPVVRILHSNDLYVKFGFLRALNLSYTDILELPRSIGNMKHLRLLALNNTKIKGLPFEVGHLDTLQTLELKDCCRLTDLPESISNLVKLRHLDVGKETGNVKVSLPHGIGQLTDLQTLTEFNIGNNLSHCSIVELKNLNGLRGHVHVTGLQNIMTADDATEANMVEKHFIEALTLEWSYSDEYMDYGLGQETANMILQNLQTNSNLQKLVVRNYAGNLFPLWMQDSYLSKLTSITLDSCCNCSELPYLGDLPSLKSLFIQRMNSIETFGIVSNSLATKEKLPPRFPSLEELTFWEMYDLQFWTGTSEGDFPRICCLSISRCPKLKNLPPLRSLVHLTVHCGGQMPSFSEFPSLESLKVEGFHKIRSITFPHQLKMLKKLEIIDCKELSSLFAYSLSVSDLKVIRCLKLDLIGGSLEDHLGQKVVGGRNSPTRRSMVLKTVTYTDLQDDGWKWEKHGEKNIFGSSIARLYYSCLHSNSTGCCAMKILQPNDTNPNMLYAMYIYEHNHEFPNESHPERSAELGIITRKRKESGVSCDEHTSKRQLNS